jgi:hypothetical protein
MANGGFIKGFSALCDGANFHYPARKAAAKKSR